MPSVKRLVITPDFVCSGDRILFDWKVKNIDTLEVITPSGQCLHKTSANTGTWHSPPAQADWDYLRLRGCQDDDCESHIHDVQIIDNPKWTCEYFADLQTSDLQICGSVLPGGNFQFIGGSAEVDYDHPYPTLSAEGAYPVYRMLDGYSYNIPRAHFSDRARVIQVKFGRIESVVIGGDDIYLNPDGMFVESVGTNAVTKTWVAKGDTLTIAAPFHPSDTTWRLLYAEPQKIMVAVQYGKPGPNEKPDWHNTSLALFPSISFEVKCDM